MLGVRRHPGRSFASSRVTRSGTTGRTGDAGRQPSHLRRTCIFCIIQSCVKVALEDLKGGYIFEAKTLLEAEVFSNLLEQAVELQRAGYQDAAAALAGGVLEKHLRSMCARRGIACRRLKNWATRMAVAQRDHAPGVQARALIGVFALGTGQGLGPAALSHRLQDLDGGVIVAQEAGYRERRKSTSSATF